MPKKWTNTRLCTSRVTRPPPFRCGQFLANPHDFTFRRTPPPPLVCAQTASAIFHPLQVKNGKFFDILTIHDDEISYLKHVLDLLCVCFHPIWVFFGMGGGGARGVGHNLLMQSSNSGSSKMEISETDFFYILTIQNDQISYVKHVLDPIHVHRAH